MLFNAGILKNQPRRTTQPIRITRTLALLAKDLKNRGKLVYLGALPLIKGLFTPFSRLGWFISSHAVYLDASFAQGNRASA
jgi:hypothetical protein